MPSAAPSFDVVIVGAGLTGLTLASLLAKAGVRIALIEKHSKLYGLPRAGHIDHEALRNAQAAGVLEPVPENASPWIDNRWLMASGETLFEFKHWLSTLRHQASINPCSRPLCSARFICAVATSPFCSTPISSDSSRTLTRCEFGPADDLTAARQR